ncbi:MAG: aspartate--ammonia ligase, partial [Angelakisella sp.]
ITRQQRTTEMLKAVVDKIWSVFTLTQETVCRAFPVISPYLPEKIAFISSQELEDTYPDSTPKEREDLIAKKHGAVFISEIGGVLRGGAPHDGRAPDYDDWSMNGDILIWYEPLGRAVELSSMGVRVDSEALERQLAIRGLEHRKTLTFHKLLLENRLPLTMGGGIGQSRICMIMLEKVHIGEVQSSVWPESMIDECGEHGVHLL